MTERTEQRRAMRALVRAHAAGLGADGCAAAAAAMARLLAANVPAGVVVASYSARGGELDPAPADALLQAMGCGIVFPRVEGAAPLAFHACARDALLAGFRGILEPPQDAPRCVPDVVLVPLVAVDAVGNRLGQGGGHYDRTLAALRAGGAVTAIGLAWEVQIVARVAAEAWDVPLDGVATPERFIAMPGWGNGRT